MRSWPALVAAGCMLALAPNAAAAAPGQLLTVTVPGVMVPPTGSAGILVKAPDGRYLTLKYEAGRLVFRRAGAPVRPERPADILPDGRVSIGGGDIRNAWLGRPTTRYAHGILGDSIEALRLYVRGRDGLTAHIDAGEAAVFEDLMPRLVDFDGDRRSEILVVKSYHDAGAAAAIYAYRDGAVVPVGETRPIGIANRWLNPVGVADFDGDGHKDLAVVVTPHIGGVLTVYRVEAGRLRAIHRMSGFSNHAIGSRILAQSAIADFNGDGVADIAVPDSHRRTLHLVSFAGGREARLGAVASPAEITGAVYALDLDGKGSVDIAFGLDGGQLAVVLR